MSIAIICNQKDPAPWQKALQQRLPDTSIEVFPNISNFEAVEFLICWKPKAGDFAQFSNLKVVQSLGAGVDHIFGVGSVPRHLQVTRIVDPQLAQDMWTFLAALVLAQMKHLTHYYNQQQQKIWAQKPYKPVQESQILILGLGAIGAYVAEQFAQFGFSVTGWSNSPKSIPGVTSIFKNTELSNALQTCDFLINILPLTPTTTGILNHQLFKQLQHTYLINVGRGQHLVEADLLPALNANWLSGCHLDVFQQEPLPPSHPFWTHPKISITPHIASLTNIKTSINQIVYNYEAFRKSQALEHLVDLEKGY